MEEVNVAIRNFVIENFLYGDRQAKFDDHDSFLEKGIVDSTGVLELVAYLEEKFKIQVGDEEIIPDHFDSVVNLTNYIKKKQNGGTNAG